MQRLLWPLALVVTFGVGLAAGGLSRNPREVESLQAEVRRMEREVSTLQARLRVREANLAGQRPQQGVETRPADRSLTAVAVEGSSRPGRPSRKGTPPPGEPQDDLTSPARVARGTAVPLPTVEAALERFYRYLDETSGAAGPARWQRVRELAADLRASGDVGTEALLRVLAGGTSSDERRAAAQLLGDLQAPQALPLLQNILENDPDVLLRRAAASALRRLDMPETIPAMQTLLANPEEDRFVRMSAAYGLAQLGKPQGVTGLEQIFDESNVDGRGRDMAFRALTSLNDPRSLPFMRQLVTSGADVSYRLQAIRFVAAQGDGQALGALQQVMQSPTEQASIRDAATQAVAAIAGR
jgi:HEAT repeats